MIDISINFLFHDTTVFKILKEPILTTNKIKHTILFRMVLNNKFIYTFVFLSN